MKKLLFLLLTFCGSLLHAQDTIQLDSSQLVTRTLVQGLTIPWDLVWGPDGWIWFNERDGDIYRLNPDDLEVQHIFTIEEVFESYDNSGCHGMALHPDFPNTPWLYVHYTYDQYSSRLVRYRYSFTKNTLEEPVVLLDQIGGNSSHNGSRIKFDQEGYMYIAMGDAFVGDAAQEIENLNGKILRMTDEGAIPDDNPFPGLYTWSFGHRNPQGLTFSPAGKLYASEHGEANDDEVNLVERGRNYGWPDVEGFCDGASEQGFCTDWNVHEPMAIWTPTYAPCGLEYFDHPSIPEWQHSLLLTFLKEKRLTVLPLNSEGDSLLDGQKWDYFVERFGRLRDVLVAPNGRLFICTSNEETNGQWVPKDNYDKIIELVNPDFDYPNFVPELPTYSSRVFPNPTADIVRISLPVSELEIRLQLVNDRGEVMLEDTYTTQFAGLWRVELPPLSPGVYTVQYQAGTTVGADKLVVVNAEE